jgi:hypothetical protein
LTSQPASQLAVGQLGQPLTPSMTSSSKLGMILQVLAGSGHGVVWQRGAQQCSVNRQCWTGVALSFIGCQGSGFSAAPGRVAVTPWSPQALQCQVAPAPLALLAT